MVDTSFLVSGEVTPKSPIYTATVSTQSASLSSFSSCSIIAPWQLFICTQELHPTMQSQDDKLYKRAIYLHLSSGNLTEVKSHIAVQCCMVWKPGKQRGQTGSRGDQNAQALKNEVNQHCG